MNSLWPALKRRDSEKCQHAHQHVIEVKITVHPKPLLHHGMIHIAILIHHEGAPG